MGKYGVNHCHFIGNLGKDPEMKYTADSVAICNFSIAVTEKWKNKDNTEWVGCVAFNKLAEICGEYLSKGSPVYVSGKWHTSSWDKDGVRQYRTELTVNDMTMLGGASKPSDGPDFGVHDQTKEDNLDVPF